MEKQVKTIVKNFVSAILKVINETGTSSLEKKSYLVCSILLDKLEEKGGIKYSEFPCYIKYDWHRFVRFRKSLSEEDKEFISKIESIVTDTFEQKKDVDWTFIIGILAFIGTELKKIGFTESLGFTIYSITFINLWEDLIAKLDEYSFVENPHPVFKILLDKYFESTEGGAQKLSQSLNDTWQNICLHSSDISISLFDKFKDTLESNLKIYSKSEDGLKSILEVALFFVNRYEAIYSGHHENSKIHPWILRDFIYELRTQEINQRLWAIVNSSYTYSFKKEPLPVFQVLVDYYKSCHIFNQEIPKKWEKTLDELENNTQNCIDNTARELFSEFKKTLQREVNKDEVLLAKVTDYFVERYAELHTEEGGEYILPKELMDFIYWYALGPDGCATELAIYNPFAGLCSYGTKHAECLNNQLYYDSEMDDSYRKSSWYHGVESNQTNRLIGSIRLFVNNPTNLEQMYISSDDSLKDEIDGFTGGWTFIATPPIASDDFSVDPLVDITTKLVNKFIEADGMAEAFFVLPKSFCISSKFYSLRSKMINKLLLECVIELPEKSFNVPFEAVVVKMRKIAKYYYDDDSRILFVDAKEFTKDGHLDDSHLLDICIYNGSSPHCVRIDNHAISQHGYCLLPKLYIPTYVERRPGEVSIRLGELISLVDRKDYEEKEGFFISNNSFRDDSKILFGDVNLEMHTVEEKSPIFEGEYLVIAYMREKFMMCKTSSDSSFCLEENQVAFKMNEAITLSLDYVISAILRNGFLKRLALSMDDREFGYGYNIYSSERMVVNNILDNEIFIHLDKAIQEETLSELKEEYERIQAAEKEAEKQRSAHREVSSDISHMLGTTFDRIGDNLSELKGIDEAKEVMMQMKDSFDYMKRLIDSVGKDFMAAKMRSSERKVNEFIITYCEGWKNYGKNTFDVQYVSSVSNDTTFKIDEVFVKVLLDTLLDNAYRHGFERYKSPEHQVKVATSYVVMDNKKYVLLSVANNGKPFSDEFTIEKYISRGEFYGESGRTGLGGNHVYSIAKRHDGFICLTKDENWNVIVEVLLPVEYYDESEIDKFVEYGNAKECM